MIEKLLIANRGEVAGRVISTCQRLGIQTVAVFSEADRDALFTRVADEAIFIGPAAPSESYLNMDAVLEAAKRSGADAIHPGYGFLAENAEFAQRVRDEGLVFVGPSSEVIDKMGSKVAARKICHEAGVPTVPGSQAMPDAELLEWADQHGYPVMLKASAGGGGKGMRRLDDRESLEKVLGSARREALKAFGSDEIYLEKALVEARHLEVQVVADLHGNAIHLGVRECSLQRRHQKIIEESPPPNASPKLLQSLTDAALTLARSVGYSNLGTVEFLVDGDDFYFLEMNTRLQVEHPVTEMVTRLDLVELQIDIAQGRVLPLAQHQIRFQGHAIEARVTCEDPFRGFLPATGTLLHWRPSTQGRYDAALEAGQKVTPHYDSMVAKIIAWGEDRDRAIRNLKFSLARTVLLGVPHNLDFLNQLLSNPVVQAGQHHTEFVESLEIEEPPLSRHQLLAATAYRAASLGIQQQTLDERSQELTFEGQPTVEVRGSSFIVEGTEHSVKTSALGVEIDGYRFPVTMARIDRDWWIHTSEGTHCLTELARLPEPSDSGGSGGSLQAPMPGSVVEILVQVGDQVTEGQTLVKLEAMKMEQAISSPRDGVVESIPYGPGDQVEAGAKLLTLKEES